MEEDEVRLNNGRRIYPEEVFIKDIQEYEDRIKSQQRDENIDAVLEDREPKKILIGLSSRGYLDGYDQYHVKGFDIVDGYN